MIWCFRSLKGYTEPETAWDSEVNFVMKHALVQDRSLELLTSSRAHNNCAIAIPLILQSKSYSEHYNFKTKINIL